MRNFGNWNHTLAYLMPLSPGAIPYFQVKYEKLRRFASSVSIALSQGSYDAASYLPPEHARFGQPR